jgi:hypothetical protein
MGVAYLIFFRVKIYEGDCVVHSSVCLWIGSNRILLDVLQLTRSPIPTNIMPRTGMG